MSGPEKIRLRCPWSHVVSKAASTAVVCCPVMAQCKTMSCTVPRANIKTCHIGKTWSEGHEGNTSYEGCIQLYSGHNYAGLCFCSHSLKCS